VIVEVVVVYWDYAAALCCVDRVVGIVIVVEVIVAVGVAFPPA